MKRQLMILLFPMLLLATGCPRMETTSGNVGNSAENGSNAQRQSAEVNPNTTQSPDENTMNPSSSGADMEETLTGNETMTNSTETAIIAGGCFWGMEEILREIDGVIHTEVGYCGGQNENATYQNHPGHAEAVKITFDPARISFKTLLTDWFFRMHDPTTLNRQGNDIGTSYRSTIFYFNDEQKKIAEDAIQQVTEEKRWNKPIVTTVEPVKNWSVAEEYHQDYLQKNPGGYTCHWLRSWD
jgi:methionine-S-sulfoxide reductase